MLGCYRIQTVSLSLNSLNSFPLLSTAPSLSSHGGKDEEISLRLYLSADSLFTSKPAHFSNEISPKKRNLGVSTTRYFSRKTEPQWAYYAIFATSSARLWVLLLFWRSVSSCWEILLMFLEAEICSPVFNTRPTQLFSQLYYHWIN